MDGTFGPNARNITSEPPRNGARLEECTEKLGGGEKGKYPRLTRIVD